MFFFENGITHFGRVQYSSSEPKQMMKKRNNERKLSHVPSNSFGPIKPIAKFFDDRELYSSQNSINIAHY